MALDFGVNSGQAMTWDISYSPAGVGWHVLMDFGGAGSIEFGCHDGTLVDVTAP